MRVRACALNDPRSLGASRARKGQAAAAAHLGQRRGGGSRVVWGTSASQPGTRVMVHPGLSCGTCVECLAGTDNRCAAYDVLGYRSDGGYAELVKVPAVNLISDSGRHPVRRGGRVSADVPDRLAHAAGSGAGWRPVRPCSYLPPGAAWGRRQSRSRSSPAPGFWPLRARLRSSSGPGRSARMP